MDDLLNLLERAKQLADVLANRYPVNAREGHEQEAARKLSDEIDKALIQHGRKPT